MTAIWHQPRSHFEMQLNLAKRGIKVIRKDSKESGTPNQSTPSWLDSILLSQHEAVRVHLAQRHMDKMMAICAVGIASES
ncbi:unnamed protein product [Cylicocyclus nassatus]|uniref:Uncharacterized protein n=1 Tax=Cylicocyclus nassatus TaxID=53992 RepID=A0AA36M434_CYLNA|nr:unnamed protein product [Cylicocyclus nassatus]